MARRVDVQAAFDTNVTNMDDLFDFLNRGRQFELCVSSYHRWERWQLLRSDDLSFANDATMCINEKYYLLLLNLLITLSGIGLPSIYYL